MPDPRTTAHVGEYVKPRFRCLVCATFVVGTERGVCPRCGYAPPVKPRDESGPVDLRAWNRVAGTLEPPVHRYARTSFLVALVVAVFAAGAMVALAGSSL